MNCLCIVGNLTGEPEVRTTSTGKEVVTACVAVRKTFIKQGEPDADFFNIEAWGSQGTYLQNYGAKGRKVSVVGEMLSNKRNDKTYWRVKVLQVSFVDKAPDTLPSKPVDPDDPFADE